ncbi:MAG TPA: hypothetical protein VE993_01125, partial [Stellaceae bacterium]|nr:hypothetical protein [Stellaceae bacterium]
ASAVEADLRQLKLVMSLYERYDRAISTAEIRDPRPEGRLRRRRVRGFPRAGSRRGAPERAP